MAYSHRWLKLLELSNQQFEPNKRLNDSKLKRINTMHSLRLGKLGSIIFVILIIAAFVKRGDTLRILGIGVLINLIVYVVWLFFTTRNK